MTTNPNAMASSDRVSARPGVAETYNSILMVNHSLIRPCDLVGDRMKDRTMSRITSVWPLLIAFGITQGAMAQGFPNVGGIFGGGGGKGLVAGIVAGTVSGLMGQILQSLTTGEQQQRQQAMQQAARGTAGSTSGWASAAQPESTPAHPSTSTRPATTAKRASYVNRGQVTDAGGKKCSRVAETISMPDGKQGTSESLVCPS